MTAQYIDIAIILIFMILMTFLGIRNIGNIQGINTFALGRRSFSTPALASTILATLVSGSGFMLTLSETYQNGLYYLIPSMCMCLSLIIIALVIIPKMEFFLGRTTVSSGMGKIYGPRVKVITALAGAIGASGSIAVQFKVFGNLGHEFLKLDSQLLTILMGAFIIWYSRWGGIKAVVKTDIIQMVAFLIALPVVAIIIYLTFDKTDSIDLSSIDKFNLSHVFGTYDAKFVDMILLGLYFAIPSLNPVTVQRVSMGLSMNQAKRAWLIAAVILILVKLISAILPFFIYIINPDLKEGEILGFIINNFTVPGIRGILAVGIIAMAMSTADSYLNISSVLIANDLWEKGILNISFKKIASDLWKKGKIDFSKMWINEKLNNADKLLNARNFTVLIGILAILLALTKNNLLKIILLTNSFYMPIVTVPLLFTIFKYKTSENCVLMAMASAFIVVCGFHISKWFELSSINIDPIIPGMAVNAITLIICTKLFYREKDNTTDQTYVYK